MNLKIATFQYKHLEARYSASETSYFIVEVSEYSKSTAGISDANYSTVEGFEDRYSTLDASEASYSTVEPSRSLLICNNCLCGQQHYKQGL